MQIIPSLKGHQLSPVPKAHLEIPPKILEHPALGVGEDVVLLQGAVAAGARDEAGVVGEAGAEDEVGGHAARVQGDAHVEGAAEVVQVALEEVHVRQAYREKQLYFV